MGNFLSAQDHPVLKVWKLLLEEWDLDYDEKALLALITWAKNYGLDTTKEAAFDFNTWAQTGQIIIQAASRGDKNAISFIKPWKLILDLIRLLNTEAYGKEWTPDS